MATDATSAAATPVPTLRIALNEHLRSTLARSSVTLDPAKIGDAAVTMLTEPTRVMYDDPRRPGHNFVLGTGRFVAINQAAGWVYGVNATPQERATTIQETVAAARRLERDIGATAWRRDTTPPWHASDDTIAVWTRGDDDALPVARFTAGPAEVVITLERTGDPAPSERLLGKTAETFYVNVGITDMSHLPAYEARVFRVRATRGDKATPLRLDTFMSDTLAP